MELGLSSPAYNAAATIWLTRKVYVNIEDNKNQILFFALYGISYLTYQLYLNK
jgi:hypothetical protein